MLPICHDLRFVSTCTFLPRFPGERSFELKQHVSNACLSVLGALAGQLVILNHNAFARLRKNDSITRSQHEPPPQNKSKQGTLHGNLLLLNHSQKKNDPFKLQGLYNYLITECHQWIQNPPPRSISALSWIPMRQKPSPFSLISSKALKLVFWYFTLGEISNKNWICFINKTQMLSNFDPSREKKILKKRSVWQFQELTCKEKQGNDCWWYLIKQLSWICINLHIQQEREAVRNHAAATGTCSWSFSCSSLRSAGT